MPARYEAAERPKTVASQPASHGQLQPPKKLGVAIFIIDGTGKYQQTERALTNLLVCRPCSGVACGLCRPLGLGLARLMIMAWAHRKAGLRKIAPRGRQNCDGMMRGFGAVLRMPAGFSWGSWPTAGGIRMGQISELFQKGPIRKNRAKAKMRMEIQSQKCINPETRGRAALSNA